jgi:hypothetical protein
VQGLSITKVLELATVEVHELAIVEMLLLLKCRRIKWWEVTWVVLMIFQMHCPSKL